MDTFIVCLAPACSPRHISLDDLWTKKGGVSQDSCQVQKGLHYLMGVTLSDLDCSFDLDKLQIIV